MLTCMHVCMYISKALDFLIFEKFHTNKKQLREGGDEEKVSFNFTKVSSTLIIASHCYSFKVNHREPHMNIVSSIVSSIILVVLLFPCLWLMVHYKWH